MSLSIPVDSFFRQRKDDVPWSGRRRNWIRSRSARLKRAGPAGRHGDVLPAGNLVNTGNTFRWSRQVHFPQDLSSVLIVSAELSIRRSSRKNQSAGSDYDAAPWRNASNILAGIAERCHAAVWNSPENLAGIQIVSR